jgi:hypothetical protein
VRGNNQTTNYVVLDLNTPKITRYTIWVFTVETTRGAWVLSTIVGQVMGLYMHLAYATHNHAMLVILGVSGMA